MSTIDLVKSAQSRNYLDFEELALAALSTKVQENPKMQSYLSKLNIVQNVSESKIVEADGDNPETDSDLKKEYDAYFKKKLKKAGIESPAELEDDAAKKKFFDDVSAGWENGKGEK